MVPRERIELSASWQSENRPALYRNELSESGAYDVRKQAPQQSFQLPLSGSNRIYHHDLPDRLGLTKRKPINGTSVGLWKCDFCSSAIRFSVQVGCVSPSHSDSDVTGSTIDSIPQSVTCSSKWLRRPSHRQRLETRLLQQKPKRLLRNGDSFRSQPAHRPCSLL